jgi:type IV pilus assembly protein PilA
MLTKLNTAREDREQGFTLIELLVVVAIIGILAAIAIPVFLNQRNSARDASVKSDLNGLAKVMETIYVTDNAYPTTTTALDAGNPQSSPGNAIVIAVTASGDGFTITGCNTESGAVYQYDSNGGGLAPEALAAGTCGSTPGITIS